MKKYRATMYVRLSSSDDLSKKEESNSITNQKILIEDFVKSRDDIKIVSEKIDDGFSGIIFERPAFKEMMKDIEDGKIDCVIVKDLSRLGREYIDTERYLQQIFPSYGVRFIAITDNIDTASESNSSTELTTSFKNILNDSYCRDISVKTRTALRVKREKGEFIGSYTKYGYKKSSENKNQLVIDEYPAQIVKDIFEMKIEGISAKGIADKLNKYGVLSPIEYKKMKGIPYPKGGYGDKDGAKWTAPTIIRILKDELYVGNLVQGKTGTLNYKLKDVLVKPEKDWIKVENTHQPIIEQKDYDLVQKIMALDTRTSPNCEEVYLFSGILICGDCGNRMTRKTVTNKGKKYIYYNCPTTKKQGCNGGMIKEEDLIDCTLHSLKSHIRNVISLDNLLNEIQEEILNKNKIKKLLVSIQLNEEKLKEINTYKTTLYQNMINEILTKDEYKIYKANYNTEIKKIENSIVLLKEEIETAKNSEDIKWIDHFKKFSQMNSLDRKAVISLIHSISIKNKKHIKINFNYQLEYEEKLTNANILNDGRMLEVM